MSTQKEIIIQTNGVTKKYGDNTVVNGVSMTIYQGDIYGFIGSNGSGKTTFIRCLMGLINPNAGEIEILGCSSKSGTIGQARAKAGAIVETPALMSNFNAYQCLKTHALLYKDKIDDKEIKDLLTLVGLDNTGNKKVKDFSLGMRQRMAIAQTLINDPKILILDEPTNGMDPQGILEMRKFLHMLRDTKGLTILISSHILGELQLLANRFGIINKGVLVDEFDGTDIELKSSGQAQLKLEIIMPNQPQTTITPNTTPSDSLQPDTTQTSDTTQTNVATSIDNMQSKLQQVLSQIFTSTEQYKLQNNQLTIDEKYFTPLNKLFVQNEIEYKFISKTQTSLEDYFVTKVTEGGV